MRATEGSGEAIGHHGELIPSIFEDENACSHRGLVSLPYRDLKSRAHFRLSHEEALSVCSTTLREVEVRRGASAKDVRQDDDWRASDNRKQYRCCAPLSQSLP